MVGKLVVGESRDKNSEAKGKCSWESFKVDQEACGELQSLKFDL
jgi:hypothetical protein